MVLIIIYLIVGISQIIILYKKNMIKEMLVSAVFTIMLIILSIGIYKGLIPRKFGTDVLGSIFKIFI